MKQVFYAAKKKYFIYALRGEEGYIYVGKSTCNRPSAIFSAHVNGKYGATKHYFKKTGPDRPVMYLLERKEMTAAEAYKYIVAWVHVFIDAGFWCINAEGVEEDAQMLIPETRKIVEMIRQEPLDSILQRTCLSKPSNADYVKEEKTTVKAESTPKAKLSVRLEQEEKMRFDLFVKKMNLNQRQAFLYLLERVESDCQEHKRSDFVSKAVREYQQANEKLQQSNNQLREKIKELKTRKMKDQSGEIRAREKIRAIRALVVRFLNMCLAPPKLGCPLDEYSYKEYKKRLSSLDDYKYPEPGQILLSLEAIVWGKGKGTMYFVLGTDDNGRQYKIRFYPKDWYTGVYIRQSPYATKGSWWLIGCQKAKDGAVDLIGAFPAEADTAAVTRESQSRKMPLDEKIMRAQENRMNKHC